MTQSADIVRFLKKYTPISNTFIDEFVSLYSMTSRPSDFVVDLDIAAKWLSARKSNLKNTLIESYKSGIDYEVQRPTNNILQSHGKGRLKHIRVTADCFKMMCMQARTPKAAEVRAYFLAVENALFTYREEIAEGMSKRIGVLERNQKPQTSQPPGTAGVIYIIRASEKVDSGYKIGRTVNLTKRLQSHGSAMADSVDVVYIYKTNCIEKVESCIKMMMKEHQYRKYKEVYQIDLVLLKKVIKGCDDACKASEATMTKVQSKHRKVSQVRKGRQVSQVSQHTGGYYAVLAPN
jgi:hypothetical protein